MATQPMMPAGLLGLDEEEVKRQALGNAALQAGLAGLMASGPSLTPTSPGQVLGQAGAVGMQAYQQGLQQAQQAQAQKYLQSALTGGGQPGQPIDRAQMADRLRNLAAQYMAIDPQKANSFLTAAEKYDQEFEKFTGTTGNLALSMFGTADVRRLTEEQRRAVTAEEQRQNLARADAQRQRAEVKPVIVDMFDESGRKVKVMLNPFTGETIRQLGGASAENTQVVTVDVDGKPVQQLINSATGEVIREIGPGKPKELSEGERNAAGFFNRMQSSSQILDPLESKGVYPGYKAAAAGAIPFVGETARNLAMTKEEQKYSQASMDWIRAKLRKESGAAIGKDEMEQEYRTYFPMPGDSSQVIEQKRAARAEANKSMMISSGGAAQQVKPPAGGKKKVFNPQTGKIEER